MAVGCACPFPTRAPEAEKLLAGSRAEVEKRLAEAAEAIADAADLIDDHEGSVDYKRNLIRVFLRRVFRKALGEAVVEKKTHEAMSCDLARRSTSLVPLAPHATVDADRAEDPTVMTASAEAREHHPTVY